MNREARKIWLRSQIRVHDALRVEYRRKSYAAQDKQEILERELAKLEHPCPCVEFNKVLGISNLDELAEAGRVGLHYRFLIQESLSALINCPLCKGTGK